MIKINNEYKFIGVNRMNKKIISISTACVAVATGIGLGIYKVLGGKTPQKYSSKWFETMPNEVLNTEREIVREKWCSSGNDSYMATMLKKLLDLFDSELSKRDWGDEIPHGPSYRREHGYNLFKKD